MVRSSAAIYRIRVAGRLGAEWSNRAQGMALRAHRTESTGMFTDLIGELVDDAALMGVLNTLYTHGALLLSVERIQQDEFKTINLDDFQDGQAGQEIGS